MPIDLIELSGSPREMGRQHGEMFRNEIRQFTDIRLGRVMAAVKENKLKVSREVVLDLARRHLPFHQEYSAAVYEEFMGISDGSGVPPEELMIGNGLTDLKDVVVQTLGRGGCTSFIANRSGTEDGKVWFGQTWDMHADAEPYVRAFHRKPINAPQTLAVTTTGCLSLAGINEEGIGVGNNNLVPNDARPGVMYLAMLHHALTQRTFEGAVRAIAAAHRASGHNYVVVSAEGKVCFIETTATDCEIIDADRPVAVHANHYRVPRLQAMRTVEKSESSLNREKRLGEVLGSRVTLERVLAGFRDREPNPQTCVCRTEGEGTTCATILGRPTDGELWATRGNIREHELVRMAL